jgi:Tol biopolymer transport system component
VAPRQVIRSTLELGGASGAAVTGVGVSPDGTRLAYLSAAGVQVRPLDRPDATLVPGTAGASDVFFSPDGRWIGFWQGGRLKRTSRDGDAAVVLAELPLLWGADWANDGTILLGQGPEGIARISAAGGARETIISDPMRLARAPQLLPGGRAVLFTSAPLSFNWNEARAMVHVLNTHESRVLIPNASNAHYVSTGHLVYVSGGRLMAVPFDAKTLTVTGAPTLIAEQVAGVVGGNTRGDSYYSVSEAGLLAYVARNDAKLARTLAWVDRQGREEPINAPPRTYFYARLSPDGKRAALDVRDQDEDIWLYDFEQETLTRLTLEPSRERAPAWTADGKRVLFDSNREGPPNIYWQNADGTGAAERLTTSSNAQFAATITRDGRSVLFQETIEPRFFIMQLDVGSGRAPAPLLGTTFLQRNPRVSPNGKFIAYESNETGRFEIYVRPFPDIDSGRWLVSTAGGLAPVWSPMGDELFYESPTGELMTVKIGPGSSWVAQRPVVLADASHDWSLGGFSAPSYDVSPDGKRFLVIKRDPGGERPQNSARVVLVSNWFEELRRQNAAN